MPQTQTLGCEEDTGLGRAEVGILSPFIPVTPQSSHQLWGQTQAGEAEGSFMRGKTGGLSALPQVDASVQMKLGH